MDELIYSRWRELENLRDRLSQARSQISDDPTQVDGIELVARYFEMQNDFETAEDILRWNTAPKGRKSRAQLLKLWSNSDDVELRYLAQILGQKTDRGAAQRELYRWVSMYMRKHGVSAEEAAWLVEKNSNPTINHSHVLRSYKREEQKNNK